MQWFAHFVHPRRQDEASAYETRGFVLNWGWFYDLITWLLAYLVFGGSEQALRQMTADLAQLQPGETVLDTLMMHHLPDDLKRQGLAEIARVLKPGGRLLVLDMKGPAGPWKSSMQDQPALMKEAGFSQVETGETRFRGLGFALGRKSLEGVGREMV